MDLAWRGTPCMVIEQRRDQPPNPRCNTTNARSMEFFRRFGIADEIRAAGLPEDHPTDVVYLTQWLRSRAHPLSSAGLGHGEDRDRIPRRGVADTGAPASDLSDLPGADPAPTCPRPWDGLAFREGWRFESYVSDGAEVVATIREIDTNAVEEVRARFLVGCEGARSTVRATMGASFEGTPQVSRTLSTFISCDRLRELNGHIGGWMFRIVGRKRYHRFVAIDGGSQWIYHHTVPDGVEPDEIDVAAELADAVGEPVDFEVLGQVDWIGRAMVADRFRDRNVFLAGDAAHIWIPMGGFGMNAGIADATNLSWKLTACLDGWGGETLLDAYEAERKPIGQQVAAAAVGINTDLMAAIRGAEGVGAPGEVGARERARVGAAIATANTTEFNSVGMQLGYYYDNSPVIATDEAAPPAFSLGDYEPTSWPGVRAPHLWLDSETSLYDRLGRNLSLLVIGDGAPDPAALVEAATTRAAPLEVVRVDAPGALELYERYSLVLVRPDQHIAWRGTAVPEDAGAVIDLVRGEGPSVTTADDR